MAKMTRKKRALSAILPGVTAAALAAPQKQSASARYGIPKLRPGELWISSVPVGLEVDPGAKSEGQPVGRTPLILDAESVGLRVTVVLRKEKDGPGRPEQTENIDFTAETTHSMWIRDAGVGTDIARDGWIVAQVMPSGRVTVATMPR